MKEKKEVTTYLELPGVVDEILQLLVFRLQLADIFVQHVEPLPGDPECRHGEDEGEDQHGDPGTVQPGAARGLLLRPLVVLRVGRRFDNRFLQVHYRLVSRDAAVREKKENYFLQVRPCQYQRETNKL